MSGTDYFTWDSPGKVKSSPNQTKTTFKEHRPKFTPSFQTFIEPDSPSKTTLSRIERHRLKARLRKLSSGEKQRGLKDNLSSRNSSKGSRKSNSFDKKRKLSLKRGKASRQNSNSNSYSTVFKRTKNVAKGHKTTKRVRQNKQMSQKRSGKNGTSRNSARKIKKDTTLWNKQSRVKGAKTPISNISRRKSYTGSSISVKRVKPNPLKNNSSKTDVSPAKSHTRVV